MCGVLISGLAHHFGFRCRNTLHLLWEAWEYWRAIWSILEVKWENWIKDQGIFLLLIILLILVTFFLDEVQTLLVREKNWNYKGYWTTRSKVFMRSWVPDQMEIWKCWFLRRKKTGVPAVKPSWNKSENQQQTKINPHENSPHGKTGGRRALAPMDVSGLHNVSGLINCKWTWTSSTKQSLIL